MTECASPRSPSNCSMASTALSCVLWWRWFGILVMFQGMDRHSGIRTVSQDAARTAGGHSAQEASRRDTERPAESMSLPPRWDATATRSKVEVTHRETRNRIPTRFFFFPPSPADCGFSAATFQAAAVGQRRRRLIFFFLFTFTPAPLLCFLSPPLWFIRVSFSPPLSLCLFSVLFSPHFFYCDERMSPLKWKINILKSAYHTLGQFTTFLVYVLLFSSLMRSDYSDSDTQ